MLHNITRGRKKRKRKPGAGTAVKVKPHIRTPRGPNTINGKRKPAVRVDSYRRGKPDRKRRKKRR